MIWPDALAPRQGGTDVGVQVRDFLLQRRDFHCPPFYDYSDKSMCITIQQLKIDVNDYPSGGFVAVGKIKINPTKG